MTAPSFTGVHPRIFACDWLRRGLDHLFAAEPRIDQVCFSLWADVVNDDQENVRLHGEMFIPRMHETGVTEEDLDEISAVRLLERSASSLWYHVPMKPDSEGSICGHYEFHAKRGLIHFEFTPFRGSEPTFLLKAEHVDGEWRCVERIVISGEDASRVDMAARDAQAVLEQVLEPDEYDMDGMPTATSVDIDSDDMLHIDLEPGTLVDQFDNA